MFKTIETYFISSLLKKKNYTICNVYKQCRNYDPKCLLMCSATPPHNYSTNYAIHPSP